MRWGYVLALGFVIGTGMWWTRVLASESIWTHYLIVVATGALSGLIIGISNVRKGDQ